MSSVLDGFNRIARRYDFLKGIVFGKAIHQSQLRFLTSIPPGGNLLILGGGSGEILPLLTEINPDCRIWFVEASSEMLRIAVQRIPEDSRDKVRFIHGTESSLQEEVVFDTVITNFFLDLFSERKVIDICNLVYAKLRREGRWLVSDFVDGGKKWQRFLLWLMYRFFAITCRIEARKLPLWQYQLRLAGMEEIAFQFFYGGFIKSAVYKKIQVSGRERNRINSIIGTSIIHQSNNENY